MPFSGAGPVLQATAGGHTPMAFSGLPPAVALVKSGSLKALATTSLKRVAALSEVPTMAKQGFRRQEAETLLFAPAGTPTDIVNRLGVELREILATVDVQRQFDRLGFTALATTPEESAERIKEELSRWAR